jgi:hypothetical protein
VRILLLTVVAAFPFLFGINFAIPMLTLRLPTPPDARGGRKVAVMAALVRSLVYAALTFGVALALHDALDVTPGAAAALTAGPFAAGILAMPLIGARLRARGAKQHE